MPKPDFVLVSKGNDLDFMNEVISYLEQGYELHGSTIVMQQNNEFNDDFLRYIQPLYKAGEKSREVRVMD
ncbi:hypothetical protein [Flavitalea sp.]|nr:hypothetical protein [Flavitalea sp.]